MILHILKKELHRVFTDRRLIVSLFIVPCISIFIIYGILGLFTTVNIDDNNIIVQTKGINVMAPGAIDLGEDFFPEGWQLCAEEAGFTEDNQRPTSVKGGTAALKITYSNKEFSFLYDASNEVSVYAYNKAYSLISKYCNNYNSETSKYLIANEGESIVSDNNSQQVMAAGLITMLLVSFVFSGATAIGADSIAGEKERQTLATMLMAPAKRHNIVMGKTLGIGVITVISALSSLLGLLLTLPINSQMFGASLALTIEEILMLSVALLLFVISTSAVISLLSTLAKTVKEANSYISPIYLFCTVVSILLLVNIKLEGSIVLYYLPLVNNILLIFKALSGSFDYISLIITVVMTIIFVLVLQGIQTKMFNNEKTYFNN